MANKNKERERRRAMVRDRAKRSQAKASGSRFFKLPSGVEMWQPEKKATYRINHLPYKVSGDHHPDDIKTGDTWYKRPFYVHFNVGPEEIAVVCPTSVGKPCPICEHVAKLKKNYDENRAEIQAIKKKTWVAYNIQLADAEDEDKVLLFAWSAFNYSDELEKELIDGDEENCDFFELDGGKTVKVRIAEDSFDKRKFLKADRVDFTDRGELSEDLSEKVVDLDEALIIPSYDKLKELFYGNDDEDEEVEDGDEDDKKSSKKGKKSSKKKDDDEDEDEDEDEPEEDVDDDEDEDDEDDKKSSKKSKSKKSSKKSKDDDEDEDEPDEDDEESGDEDESEDDDGDDDEDDKKSSKKSSKKSAKDGKKSKSKKDEDWDDDEEDQDEPEEDDGDEDGDDDEDEDGKASKSKSKSKSKGKAKDGKKSSKKSKDADDDWDD